MGGHYGRRMALGYPCGQPLQLCRDSPGGSRRSRLSGCQNRARAPSRNGEHPSRPEGYHPGQYRPRHILCPCTPEQRAIIV